MSNKTKTNKTDKISTNEKTLSKSKTKQNIQYIYTYVFNGGVLKQNHCVIGVSVEHPETTVFNELKKYYGNEIKGAYYKCSKTEEEIRSGIKYKISDCFLTDIICNKNFTETKKILLEVTGLKQCSGTINIYKDKNNNSDNDNDDDDNDEKNESDNENNDNDNDNDKQINKSKESKSKESKSKDSKSKESKSKELEKDSKKTKNSKNNKKIVQKESNSDSVSESDSESESDLKIQKIHKNNNKSIELSDDSDDEEEG